MNGRTDDGQKKISLKLKFLRSTFSSGNIDFSLEILNSVAFKCNAWRDVTKFVTNNIIAACEDISLIPCIKPGIHG